MTINRGLSVRSIASSIFKLAIFYLPLGIVTTVICIVVGELVYRSKSPEYRAAAVLQFDPLRDVGVSQGGEPTALLADNLLMGTEVALLESQGLALRVLENPEIFAHLAPDDVGADEQSFAALARFSRNLRVEREGTTFLIKAYFTDPNPEMAAAIANEVFAVYIESKRAQSNGELNRARRFLLDRADELQAELHAAETQVDQFIYENDLPLDEARSPLAIRLSDLINQQVEAQRSFLSTETQLDLIATLPTRDQSENPLQGRILSVDVSPLVTRIQSQYIDKLFERAEIQSFSRGDARVANVDRELQNIADTLYDHLDREKASLNATLISLQNSIERNERAIQDVRAAQSKISSKVIDLRQLELVASSLKNQHVALLSEIQSFDRSSANYLAPADIVGAATPPIKPISPIHSTTLVVATIFGILMSGLLSIMHRFLLGRVIVTQDLPSKPSAILWRKTWLSRMVRRQGDLKPLDAKFDKLLSVTKPVQIGLIGIENTRPDALLNAAQNLGHAARKRGKSVAIVDARLPATRRGKPLQDMRSLALSDFETPEKMQDTIKNLSEGADFKIVLFGDIQETLIDINSDNGMTAFAVVVTQNQTTQDRVFEVFDQNSNIFEAPHLLIFRHNPLI